MEPANDMVFWVVKNNISILTDVLFVESVVFFDTYKKHLKIIDIENFVHIISFIYTNEIKRIHLLINCWVRLANRNKTTH